MILGLDLVRLCRDQFAEHGTTPADLFGRLTPSQFVALFTRAAGGPAAPDRVAEVTRVNDDRGRRGLLPVLPSWL